MCPARRALTAANPSAPRMPSRVLIVDDPPLVRRALTELLRDEPQVTVCGEAEDAPAAWRAIEQAVPDLMILDLSLRDSDGLELIKSVHSRYPRLLVLVVSMHNEKLYAPRALRAGAAGYVQKQEPPEAVLQAVREVLAGRVYVSPEVAERVLHRMVGEEARPGPTALESLSDRELEVLKLMGEGQTTQTIARLLHLSPKTVQSHRERLKLKLHLGNTAELVRFAVESRLRDL
jgi:DNA-binding NarL/FixJ family response regulator